MHLGCWAGMSQTSLEAAAVGQTMGSATARGCHGHPRIDGVVAEAEGYMHLWQCDGKAQILAQTLAQIWAAAKGQEAG